MGGFVIYCVTVPFQYLQELSENNYFQCLLSNVGYMFLFNGMVHYGMEKTDIWFPPKYEAIVITAGY